MYRVDLIVGARPNFMKAAPILRAAQADGRIRIRLVHTGQHYDEQMNDAFFRDLGMPRPDIALGIGGGTHGEQVGKVLIAYEKILMEEPVDAVMVVGDVNSTIATAMAAVKLQIPVIHVEAGLRSRDWDMPEEINRLLTDSISRLMLTPSRDADENLRNEGVAPERIRFVGNVMIDTLFYQVERIGKDDAVLRELGLADGKPFVLATLHRPSNVDEPARLAALVDLLGTLAARVPVLFPIHPRTRQRLETAGMLPRLKEPDGSGAPAIYALPPLGYNRFLPLMRAAAVVMTDSGGVQEETTALGVPCLTLRENTERPITVAEGTNTVVGSDDALALKLAEEALAGRGKRGRAPEGWDGHAAERMIDAVAEFLGRLAADKKPRG